MSTSLKGAPLFDPRSISGLTLWLDSTDRSKMTLSGSSITSITDKSSSAYRFTASATAPTISGTAYNGFYPILFSGSSFLLNSSFSYTLNNRSAFIVCAETVGGNNNGYLSFAISGTDYSQTNAIVYESGYKPYGQYFQLVAAGLTVSPTGTINAPTPFAVYGDTFGSGAETLYSNGTVIKTSSTATTYTDSTGLYLGARMLAGSVGNYLTGVIAEVILFSRALTTSERQQIEGYLAWKWGLSSSLPSNHPFRDPLKVSSIPIITAPLKFKSSSVFDPRTISGCQLWLDAADRTTMTFSGGSNLQTWRNKILGGGLFTQAGTAARLTYSSSNTYPLINFDSDGSTSNAWMTGTIPFTANTTCIQVMTPIAYSVGTWSFYWSWQWTNVGDRVPGFRSLNSSRGLEPYIAWVGNNNNTLSVTNGTQYLSFVEFTNGGLNTRYSINGNTPSSGTIAASNANSSTFILGGDGNAGATVWGKQYLYEIIMYSNVLTTAQRQQVEGYLAWKWGFANNLPASHPYKNTLTISQFSYPITAPRIKHSRFAPTQISGCALWLDAADASTVILNGTSVTQWNDKSGNTRNLSQGTLANSPLYTSVNRRFMIDFIRANKTYLINTSISQIYTNFTLFIIFQRKNIPSDNERIFVAIPVGYATDWNTTTGFSFNTALEVASNGSGTVFSDNSNLNLNMYSLKTTNNVANLFKNGNTSSILTKNLGLNGNSIGILLGSGTNSGINAVSEQLNGYIGEVVLFYSPLSLVQQQQVEGYLAWKWGLQTNLPSTHPYAKFPPTP